MYQWDIVRSSYNRRDANIKNSIEAEDVYGAIIKSMQHTAHIPNVYVEYIVIDDKEFIACYDVAICLVYRRVG